ncbi:lipopolysaccharide biosynthesis protein [Microbacterium sp. LMI1-1-1.1]|uniref:lipopolysaccharide biosynthesis protein n=1 Tax=Microbacterium sp. LMI1-1-1.1 TaxID=3135223 RepID=UPI0034660ED4
MRRGSSARRLGGFVLSTGFGSAVTLLAVPVVIDGAGPLLWGVQAAIQSAAGLFGVLVAFGWGTTGAAEVASMPPGARPQWYADSLVSRLFLFALGYPLMVLVMWLLNPTLLPLVVIASAAYLVPSLGGAWYFVGEARPDRLFRLEVLPQALGILASLPVMIFTRDLALTMLVQLLFNVLAVSLSARVILRGSGARVSPGLAPAFRRLGGQRHAVVTSATSALYVATPLLVLNALAPAALPVYAMGDKLFRFALTAFAPILHFVQGWISERGPEHRPERIRRVMTLIPLVSLAGGACIVLLGPWAAGLLSQSAIPFGPELSVPFAVVLFAVTLSQVLGLACLVQLGRARDLAASTLLGAVVGAPMLVAGALAFGAPGVAWALALSEVLVVLYQGAVIVRLLRTRPAS